MTSRRLRPSRCFDSFPSRRGDLDRLLERLHLSREGLLLLFLSLERDLRVSHSREGDLESRDPDRKEEDRDGDRERDLETEPRLERS